MTGGGTYGADVSVVVPCYQSAETVTRAIESVGKQTIRPREVIVVDDGSNDETAVVLGRLQARYGEEWLRVLSLGRNGGVSAARNVGWDASVGKYVAFLDADDVWHDRKLEVQYSWMECHADVVMSGHRCVMVEAGKALDIARVPASPIIRVVRAWQVLLWNPFVTPSLLVRRSLPNRFNSEQRYCEDHLFLMQTVLCGHRVTCIDSELVYVFKTPGETGASGHLWKMRVGSVKNYLILWRGGQLQLLAACALAALSMIKGILMLMVGPRAHFAMRRLLEELTQGRPLTKE